MCDIEKDLPQYFFNLPHIISVVWKVQYFGVDCSESQVLR